MQNTHNFFRYIIYNIYSRDLFFWPTLDLFFHFALKTPTKVFDILYNIYSHDLFSDRLSICFFHFIFYEFLEEFQGVRESNLRMCMICFNSLFFVPISGAKKITIYIWYIVNHPCSKERRACIKKDPHLKPYCAKKSKICFRMSKSAQILVKK